MEWNIFLDFGSSLSSRPNAFLAPRSRSTSSWLDDNLTPNPETNPQSRSSIPLTRHTTSISNLPRDIRSVQPHMFLSILISTLQVVELVPPPRVRSLQQHV